MLPIFTLVMLLITSTAYAELTSASPTAINQALISGKPTVIDLGAKTCFQCKKMAPILESLATEYQGRARVLFVDVSTDPAVADHFKVRMIPTQIFFDARGKEIKRHTGFMNRAELITELKAAGLR